MTEVGGGSKKVQICVMPFIVGSLLDPVVVLG